MYHVLIALLLINSDLALSCTSGTICAPYYTNPYIDAQYINNALDRNLALQRLLPYRTFQQRQKINAVTPLVPGNYEPLTGNTFQDAIFALVSYPKDTFTAYLHTCLEDYQAKAIDCSRIIMEIFIVADNDRQMLITTYNSNPNFGRTLQDAVNANTQNDHKHFLQELLWRRREPEPDPSTIDKNEVHNTVMSLINESQNWENNRKLLDSTLMNRSKAFVQQVIAEFRKVTGTDMAQMINQRTSDGHLHFGYSCLIDYVNNGFNFVASRIHDSQYKFDQHATKILFITAYSETCLYDINTAFKQNYGMSISQFLLTNNNQDPTDIILAEVADDTVIQYCGYYNM